ncbi:hypothetical protein FRC03_005726 [Tulasnella sp. 419]|nr:hypothetical protein FRC03_005726 [Tulasnella sp. 419]
MCPFSNVSVKGVINVYLGKAPSGQTAATWDGSGSNWFKISELSAITNGGSSIKFPADNLSQYTFKIPTNIDDGYYLVRIEHIGLHVAQSLDVSLYLGGAQFYIACGQLKVSGGNGGSPSTVSIPGVYTGA